MSKLQTAVLIVAFAVAGTASASADGYYKEPKAYGYAPGPEVVVAPDAGEEVYRYTEVKIRYRGAPRYGYGAAYVAGPPRLWRQQEVAYDAIFTQEKRIIYDAGRAAQTRAVVKHYAPEFHYAPPRVGMVAPVLDPAGTCGTFRYWDGAECVDARYYSRYRNPYRWEFIRD